MKFNEISPPQNSVRSSFFACNTRHLPKGVESRSEHLSLLMAFEKGLTALPTPPINPVIFI